MKTRHIPQQKLFAVIALSLLCLLNVFAFSPNIVYAAGTSPMKFAYDSQQVTGDVIPPPVGSTTASHDNRQNGFILGKATENNRRLIQAYSNRNAGMGMWYITNGKGFVILQGTIESPIPARGAAPGVTSRFTFISGTFHVEQQILDALKTLPNQLDYSILPALIGAGPNSVLHVVVFTQLTPCSPCQGRFDPFLNDMKIRIESAALTTPKAPSEPGNPTCSCPSNDPNQFGASLSVYNTTDQSQYGRENSRTMNANNNNVIGTDVTGVTNAFYGYRGYRDPQETY